MLGPAHADDPRQPLRAAGGRNDAEAEFRLAELRRLGRNADVARQRQLAAAAERVAVDRRQSSAAESARPPSTAPRRWPASPSSRVRSRMSLMSEPDTNADSPAPVMITTPASSLPARSPSAARHSSTGLAISAFLTAGRSMVSVAIESDRSTRILIHAPTHLAAEPAGLDVLHEQRARAVLLAQRRGAGTREC